MFNIDKPWMFRPADSVLCGRHVPIVHLSAASPKSRIQFELERRNESSLAKYYQRRAQHRIVAMSRDWTTA